MTVLLVSLPFTIQNSAHNFHFRVLSMSAPGLFYLYPWWSHQMETFSTLLAICAGNTLVNSEFPTQRPATGSFDVFFDLRLNKRWSKRWWGWWFETPSWALWCHCNALRVNLLLYKCVQYCSPASGVTLNNVGNYLHETSVILFTKKKTKVVCILLGTEKYSKDTQPLNICFVCFGGFFVILLSNIVPLHCNVSVWNSSKTLNI